jgi:photosystem II protein PsbQ
MLRFRAILTLILVAVTTFLVSCGSPDVIIPPTYTPEKIEQLQVYVAPLESFRESLATLEGFIRDRNWTDTRTYIHGPLGLLRQTTTALSRSLLPKDQPQAAEIAKDLFGHLEKIDFAASTKNIELAQTQYKKAVTAFDSFLALIPKAS